MRKRSQETPVEFQFQDIEDADANRLISIGGGRFATLKLSVLEHLEANGGKAFVFGNKNSIDKKDHLAITVALRKILHPRYRVGYNTIKKLFIVAPRNLPHPEPPRTAKLSARPAPQHKMGPRFRRDDLQVLIDHAVKVAGWPADIMTVFKESRNDLAVIEKRDALFWAAKLAKFDLRKLAKLLGFSPTYPYVKFIDMKAEAKKLGEKIAASLG